MLLVLLCLLSSIAIAAARHVLIIGVDGLGSFWVKQPEIQQHAPTIYRLATTGVIQYGSTAYYLTDSKPNWAAFFMGAGPEQTGVYSNSWFRPQDYFWPTIFYQAHLSNLTCAMYTDHQVVLNLLNPGDVDYLSFVPNSGILTTNFVNDVVLIDETPEMAFIHFDDVDAGGHSDGWGSQTYFEMIAKVDGQIQQILDAYSQKNIEPLILLTSDHGGLGTGHGCINTECFEIHFLIHGPTISPANATLLLTRTNADVACTALEYLGIEIPAQYTCVSPSPEVGGITSPAAPSSFNQAFANTIAISYSADYRLEWNDEGSTADSPVSFWNINDVVSEESLAVFGSIIAPSRNTPTFTSPYIDLSASSPSSVIVATAYNTTWTDAGSGADLDGTIFNAVCPDGFASVGEIASGSSMRIPPVGVQSVCIANECLVQCHPGQKIWDDRGSGSDADVSMWSVDPLYSSQAFDTHSFRSMQNYDVIRGQSHAYDRPISTTYKCVNINCLFSSKK